MNEELKRLMQKLGDAINESLSDSDCIAAAIGEIKRAGYDVFLVLEAMIGFKKRDNGSEGGDMLSFDPSEAPPTPFKRSFESTGKITLTPQDQKFLKALKIGTDLEDTK
jgi:hypothetical protein